MVLAIGEGGLVLVRGEGEGGREVVEGVEVMGVEALKQGVEGSCIYVRIYGGE